MDPPQRFLCVMVEGLETLDRDQGLESLDREQCDRKLLIKSCASLHLWDFSSSP
jgi:hypothetical protein